MPKMEMTSGLVAFCILVPFSWGRAQCSFELSTSIPDNQSITVTLDVNGLSANDLGVDQSVCAVTLEFRHSYLGDLTIELISPSGQSIQLIGPVTSAITPTNLTTWDIQMLPCAFPVSPDDGFDPTWSNDQPWQVFQVYNGSYYPSNGCLEDFNTGPANGIWQFVITDNDALQDGDLISIGLVFCDNSGLECTTCEASAGVFGTANVTTCTSGLTQDHLQVSYEGGEPDPDDFNYGFFVSADGNNFAVFEALNTSLFASGSWTVCGVSYSAADSAALFDQLNTLSLDEVQTLFASGVVDGCAALTAPCLVLNLIEEVDTTYISETVCQGESVQVGDESINSAGVHVVELQRDNGCDSIVVLDLTINLVRARITQADTIACDNYAVILDGTNSTVGSGAQYLWTTDNGMFTGSTISPMVTINGPGMYTLQVSDNTGCSDSRTFEAIVGSSLPFVSIDGGVIDCNNPAHNFTTVTFPSDVTYSWSGPNGFTSALPAPIATVPGHYQLRVRDASGCEGVGNAIIDIDTATSDVVINDSKNCNTGVTRLALSPGNATYSYTWNGPAGFASTERVITVSDPGLYTGTIIFPNGCSRSVVYNVDSDYSIPDLAVLTPDDTLNCGEEIILTANSSVPGLMYNWSGPNGLSSNQPGITVLEAGVYSLTVEAPNLCRNTDQITIVAGDDLVEIESFTDTITCFDESVLIGVFVSSEIVSYGWSGPSVVDTLAQFIVVDQPGMYILEFTDTSGCMQFANINVEEDRRRVAYSVITDTATCASPTGTITFTNPNQTISSYMWTLPGGGNSTDSVIVGPPGLYQLTVTGETGCPRERNVRIEADTMPPVLFLESELIGCNDSAQITTIYTDSLKQFSWSGPLGYSSNAREPFVSERGDYDLSVIGSNGCPASATIFVDTSYMYPSYNIEVGLLDCIDSVTTLEAFLTSSDDMLRWIRADSLLDTMHAIVVRDTGAYILEVENMNSCIVRDTVVVLPPVPPRVYTRSDTVNCYEPAVTLQAFSDSNLVNFAWYGSEGILETDADHSTSIPGMYRVVATGANGCTSDTTVAVTIDTMAPTAVAQLFGRIRCANQEVSLDATASVGDSLAFSWTSTGGSLIGDSTLIVAMGSGEGVYHLQVRNQINGCTDRDSARITADQSTLQQILLTLIAECQGNAGGVITVDGVSGSTTDLLYLINDSDTSLVPEFSGLPSGDYVISAVDSFGCRIDTMVTLPELRSGSSISLGPDLEVSIGNSVSLSAILDVDPSILTNIFWTPTMPCDSCLQNTLTPVETGVYTISIVDAYGCIASDEVRVFVVERATNFIPNIFSPNNDGNNDYLTIGLHPSIRMVHAFRIFDRWGNQVYGTPAFPSESNLVKWDGTLDGVPLNPGIYTYVIDIELITGRREWLSGDITLVR